ncbi:MAG: hypothetical protein SAJ12_17795 [Jaaginema sp. PMC 1079.18]|nr:hypothetical protein [Jaaginema sp. PMC 1080.18]MEC4852836.1 hypothetical protein [Jaaginema sp. PMC 1079.18]MEC4864720.1 hypothetical protein [Jaaginema sp. PMC 1078.18]
MNKIDNAIRCVNLLLALKHQEPEDNQEQQEILKRTYLSDRDPRSWRDSSKLILLEVTELINSENGHREVVDP